MTDMNDSWGVYRNGILVSSSKGMTKTEALEQRDALNKFNGMHGKYIAQEMKKS